MTTTVQNDQVELTLRPKKDDSRVDYGFHRESPLVLIPLNPDAKARVGETDANNSIQVGEQLLGELKDEGWVFIPLGK